MFIIMLWLEGKNELRVIRRDAVLTVDSQFYCAHHSGEPLELALPPGATSLADLTSFESSDCAWRSIRDDYCPSLHP